MEPCKLTNFKIHLLEHHSTKIDGCTTKTKIILDHFKWRTYWMLGKLEGFKEGDYVNLEYSIVYVNEYPSYWITSIQIVSESRPEECKCIVL